jgi:membrane protease YdiL (CAAX protease family)
VPLRVVSAAAGAVLLLAFVTVGAAVQVLNVGVGLWFTELLLFLGIPWVLLRHSGRAPARATGLSRVSPGSALVGLLAGAFNFPALVVPLQFLSTSLAPEPVRRMFDQARVFEQLEPWELGAVLAGVVVAAPLCEEFFFRGLLQKGISEWLGGRGAVRPLVLTALLFSVLHFDPVGFLARWELGLLFGLLSLRTGSLWPGILAHAANNGVSAGLFLAARGSGEEAPLQLPQVLVLAAVGWAGFGLLWLALRGREAASGEPAQGDGEGAALPGERPALLRLAAPWLVAGVLSVGLLFELDPRGVELNLVDVRGERLEPIPRTEKGPRASSREALHALRRQARRGEVPVSLYEERRRAVVEAERAPGPRAP